MIKRATVTISSLHGFFAILRVITLIGGICWLLLGPIEPVTRLRLAWLFGSFIIYSLVLYALVFRDRLRLERMYFVALFLDFAFIAVLVTLTGGHKSTFVLAFYLLIGLHSFYYGLKVGLSIGIAASIFYLMTNLGQFAASSIEELFKVGFMLLTGLFAGLISDQAKRDREKIEQLVEQLKEASRVIEQSEKIALLGRLSAGIAHEINNPVSVIATRTERMLLEAKEQAGTGSGNEGLISDLEVINKQAHRTASIIRSMLAFSRHESMRFVPLDINEVVDKAVGLIEHRLSDKDLTLNLNLHRHLPRIRGDGLRLQEVLINILNNAIDATRQNGQIYVITTLSGDSENVLQVLVSDTGDGIKEDYLGKVFDPFFTTKDVGHGTGLGLYVTYHIIKEHGGTIRIESKPDQGTTVTISLPLNVS